MFPIEERVATLQVQLACLHNEADDLRNEIHGKSLAHCCPSVQ